MALLDPLAPDPVMTCIPLVEPTTLGIPAAAAALDAENPDRFGFLVALTLDKPCSNLA